MVVPVDGNLTELLVEQGDVVEAGQPWVTALGVDGTEHTLTAPIDGRVISQPERVGVHLELDESVVTLEPVEGERQLRMFVAPSEAEQVAVGIPAVITFPGREPIEGRVAAVGGLPLTHEEIHRTVGNEALAHLLLGDLDAAVDVVVVADDGADLPDEADAGRFASVTLIIDSVPPIRFVL